MPYHLLDENILAKHAYIDGNSLVINNFRYKYIIIPEGTLTMDKTTKELFEQYAENGGKFYIVKDAPTYLEGTPYKHSYMKNNCSFEDIIASKPYYSSFSDSIRLEYRELDGSDTRFIYAINLGEESDIEIRVDGYLSFKCGNQILSQKIHFNKSESKILFFSNEKPEATKKLETIRLNKSFKVIGKPLNYLTLDYLSYSTDGINYSNKMHYMAAFNLLLESRYQGDVYLKYNFNLKHIPTEIEALIEDTNILEVRLNNTIIKKNGIVLEKDLWSYQLVGNLVIGENEILIKINFVESTQVYYALYGENVQESIKNCLVYLFKRSLRCLW